MFTLDEVAKLAADMDDSLVEQGEENAPAIVGLDWQRSGAPQDKASAIRNITDADRIVYLDQIDTVPRYRRLVDELAPEVMRLINVDPADVEKTEGYMFISGGRSTTMAHVDHECNVLMVLEGAKRVWLSDIGDPEAEIAVEAMYSGLYGSCRERPASLQYFDIHAGEGIFIAPRAAHMIENHPGRCVALSIVVTPTYLEHEADVYRFNDRLRKRGVSPRPPGESPALDRAKRALYSAGKSAASVARSK